ncbi:MAG: hypothetical protein KDI36_01085 [Pseudomonadales bacterium]|nr:hypothetical protein [Pseudomonadales bacterium]
MTGPASLLQPLFKRGSLRRRLLLTASLVLFVFLGLMGLVLDQAFQRSTSQGISERLLVHIYGLLAVTEESGGELFLPEALQEPELNHAGSGLAALVLDDMGQELWRSPSAVDLILENSAPIYEGLEVGASRFGVVSPYRSDPVFFKSYRVIWQLGDDQQTSFTYVILQSMNPFQSEIRGFRNNLWTWLTGVAVALLLVQWFVMSWGLSPLQNLADELQAIEDGKTMALSENYPQELEGVTRNLNLLLLHEREQREKYRTTLGDLAHSLKTPLAILKGSTASLTSGAAQEDINAVQETVEEQVSRMDEIVAYQLEQAVLNAGVTIRKSIEISPLVDKLVNAMGKVWQAREPVFEIDVSDAHFFGDERDFMELLGNLVDNACKYGNGRVVIQAANDEITRSLKLVIEDDGPGIDENHRSQVLQRGARLDSRESGQGIGLAVVGEIVRRYGGEIEVTDALSGGTRMTISLPG